VFKATAFRQLIGGPRGRIAG